MCLHIQNLNFEKYTENMLDRLAEGAGNAKEQLAAVARSTEQLGRDADALKEGTQAALGLLHQHSELEEVRRGLRGRMFWRMCIVGSFSNAWATPPCLNTPAAGVVAASAGGARRGGRLL